MPAPLASVVIPNWNGAHLLRPCLDSLVQQSYGPLEVIVADGGSVDGSVGLIRESWPEVRVIALQRNRGFAGNVNAGLRAARGEVLLLLNNDAEAERDWVESCVEALARTPGTGSVASKILFQDRKTLNGAGDLVTRSGRALQRGCGEADGPAWDVPAPVFGASGGAAAYRRSMLTDVGMLDESFFMYLEDVDLAFRAQLRGWSCAYEPSARVYHRGSATGGVLASYYNGRNSIRLLAKNMPSRLLRDLLSTMLAYQVRRAREAAVAWRGAAARATLRGQLAGLAALPSYLGARKEVQSRRRISDAALVALLEPEA